MGFVSQLTQQLGRWINSQSTAQRFTMIVLILGTLAAMGWLTMHARTGTMVVLYESLPPGDGVTAAAKLHQAKISAKLEEGGARLKVASRDADQAMLLLAMEGIPSAGVMGWEGLDRNTMGQSKQHQEKNFHRMREGELARTLMTMIEIDRARVHLALPEQSVFLDEAAKPTASVVLKLRHGVKLGDRQISGIVHLVSHAVEGLDRDNVSVIDHLGNLLTSGSDSENRQSTMQIEFKTSYENDLKNKIESMLEKVVGRGKVVARVQADFNYQTSHEISEIYNPLDQEPILETQRKSNQVTRSATGSESAEGSGSDANLPATSAYSLSQADGGGPVRLTNDITEDYAVSKRWVENTQNMPVARKISVALLVDGVYEQAEGADPEFRKRTDGELEELVNLAKAAIGFTEDRKLNREDLITIACMPFKLDSLEMDAAPMIPSHLRRFVEIGLEWGMLGLIAVLLIFAVLRPAMKSILVTPAQSQTGRIAAQQSSMGIESGGDGREDDVSTEELEAIRKLEQIRKESGVELLDAQAIEKLLNSDNHGMTSEEIRLLKSMALDQNRPQQFQSILASQAKNTQAKALELQKSLAETVTKNSQHTVGLIRQWMEEA